MKKQFKRILSVLLAVLLIGGLAPAAFADGGVTYSGVCGSNARWKLVITGTGVLTISGFGPMMDFAEVLDVPWINYVSSIQKIIIENGVTSVGNYAFSHAREAQEVTIPDSVTRIGDYAFSECRKLTAVTVPDRVTSIGEFAFYDCPALQNVTIGLSVQSIGCYAFCPDQALTLVYYTSDEAGWNTIRIAEGNDALLLAERHCYIPTLDKTSLTMIYKKTAVLTASEPVNWTSSDEGIVQVNADGVLTAVKRGTAEIMAISKDGNHAAGCTVTVKYAWWQWLIVIFLFGWAWY